MLRKHKALSQTVNQYPINIWFHFVVLPNSTPYIAYSTKTSFSSVQEEAEYFAFDVDRIHVK